jgi:hypothetical protein
VKTSTAWACVISKRISFIFIGKPSRDIYSERLYIDRQLVQQYEINNLMKIVEIFTESGNPIFFSTLTRAVQAIPQPKAPGLQWANMLANLTNKGVKQSELEWSGILDWLKTHPASVTKEEVLQYIQSHEVQVHDTTHGVARDTIAPDEQAGQEHGPAWDRLVGQIRDADAEHYNRVRSGQADPEWGAVPAPGSKIAQLRQQQDDLHSRMINDTMARQGLSGEPAAYSGYKLPGGKDYRELLLTTPAPQHQIQIGPPQPPGGEYGNRKFAARWNGGELVQGVTEYPFQIGDQTGSITYWPTTIEHVGYKTSTTGPPKFIVNATFMQNARFDTLEAATNEITQRYNNSNPKAGALHRKDVYKGPHWREPNVLAHVRFDTRTDQEGHKVLHVAEVQSDWHQAGRKKGYQGDTRTLQWRASPDHPKRKLVIAYDESGKAVGTIEPLEKGYHLNTNIADDAPLQWRAYSHESGTIGDFDTAEEAKNAVQENIQNKGVPNAPFRKEWPQLAMKRMLRYAAEHGYDQLTWDMGETSAKRYDLSKRVGRIEYDTKPGKLTAWGPSGKGAPILQKDKIAPENLDNYIGKELANKLINAPTEVIQNSDYFGPTHVLAGMDMKVGGEGMTGFYDQILPSLMNKWGKKWGVRVAQTKIDTSVDPNSNTDVDAEDDIVVKTKKRWKPAWGIAITPEMRDSILQGQPLWEQFERNLSY